MRDLAPIRGRWRGYVCPDCGWGGPPWPDEAAIERGAKAIQPGIDALRGHGHNLDARAIVEAVLRAALEPPEAG